MLHLNHFTSAVLTPPDRRPHPLKHACWLFFSSRMAKPYLSVPAIRFNSFPEGTHHVFWSFAPRNRISCRHYRCQSRCRKNSWRSGWLRNQRLSQTGLRRLSTHFLLFSPERSFTWISTGLKYCAMSPKPSLRKSGTDNSSSRCNTQWRISVQNRHVSIIFKTWPPCPSSIYRILNFRSHSPIPDNWRRAKNLRAPLSAAEYRSSFHWMLFFFRLKGYCHEPSASHHHRQSRRQNLPRNHPQQRCFRFLFKNCR